MAGPEGRSAVRSSTVTVRGAAYRGAIHMAGKGLLWPALAILAAVIVLASLVLAPRVAASAPQLASGPAGTSQARAATAAAAPSPPTAQEKAAALSVDGSKFVDSVLPKGNVVELAVQHDHEALADFLRRYDQLSSPKALTQVNRRTSSLPGERWVVLVPIKFKSTEAADAWCASHHREGQDMCDVLTLTPHD